MTQCGDIENKLSAYFDGVLSAGEKKLVEEHLAHCARCSANLSELKKTEDLLHSLKAVDPPPWFTQKVMARVREESTSRKGLLKKLFYPFHIKLPIEVMAMCLVAILIFSVYRTTGPEMKALHEPQASTVTAPQELARKELDRPPLTVKKPSSAHKTDPGVSPEKQKDSAITVVPDGKVNSGLQYNTASPAAAPERYKTEKKHTVQSEQFEQEIKADASLGKSDSQTMQEGAPSPAPLPKAVGGSAPSQERTLQKPAPANKLRAAKEFQGAAPVQQDRYSIVLHTNNRETALKETEDLLNRFSARHINIISRHENSIILFGDLPGQKIREFLKALKEIGTLKDNGLSAPSQEEYIKISIAITASR